jgi:predicted DNA-binding transcriptional regulator YafY
MPPAHVTKCSERIARLLHVVHDLYAFERLRAVELAERYGVSAKTALRDLQAIGAVIPLSRKRGVYRLDTSDLSQSQRLPSAVLRSFASNAGLSIACLNDTPSNISMIRFAITYDGINRSIAEAIIESIEQERQCTFGYTNNRDQHATRTVSPIKLYTEQGKWYLLAKDSNLGELRMFDFLKIKSFRVRTDLPSDLTPDDIAEAEARPSIWSSSDTEPIEVRIEADAYAARYLDEVPLHPSQKLLSPHADGSATYLYTITHPMELLPKIKSWIPHLHIDAPKTLRQQLIEEIDRYRKELK